MNQVAPVTNTRMPLTSVDLAPAPDAPGYDTRCRHQATGYNARCHHLYDGTMPRWDPDANGRLLQAAMELFTERGYEHVTVA